MIDKATGAARAGLTEVCEKLDKIATSDPRFVRHKWFEVCPFDLNCKDF